MENSGKAIDSVSFTGWPDAGIIPFGTPDGDGGTPTEIHPHVRDGGAYTAGLAVSATPGLLTPLRPSQPRGPATATPPAYASHAGGGRLGQVSKRYASFAKDLARG